MYDVKLMLEEARADYDSGMNWMDFNNKYFGNGNKYWPKDSLQRSMFSRLPEVEEINAMKDRLEENQPDVTEPKEKEYSGAISLRVPKSLHRFLAEEADREGVSLNQLILAKISASLYDQLRGRR